MCIFLIFGLCTICTAAALFFGVPIIYFASLRPILADEDGEAKKDKGFSNQMLVMGWLQTQKAIPKWANKKGKKKKKEEDSDSDGKEGGADEENGLIAKNKNTYKRSGDNRE